MTNQPTNEPTGNVPKKTASRTALKEAARDRKLKGAVGVAERFYRIPRAMAFWLTMIFSFLTHALVAGLIAGVLLVLMFLGFNVDLFKSFDFKDRDIEFVLVQNPEAPPRNKNTRNRAKHATRAGGEKTKAKNQAEPSLAAGAQAQKPAKAKAAAQPKKTVRKPTPRRRTKTRVTRKVNRTPKPTRKPPKHRVKSVKKPPKPTRKPPRPSAPRPVRSSHRTPTLPPSPHAPRIKTPAGPSPKAPRIASAGPVVKSSTGSRTASSGRSGRRGPSQIAGGPKGISRSGRSGGGRSSAGRRGTRGGRGGRGAYTQPGSPGGGGGRPGIDALPEPDYGAYMAELQRRIKRNWRPPSAQEDKRIMVTFTIGRDGRLRSVRLKRPSGFKQADAAALAAVRLSAPFRPLPAGHRDPNLVIEFTFDYNVFKGRGRGIRRRG